MFARRAISIPRPEFFVVYNGEEPLKHTELYLKANLGGNDEFITMKVKIMDITYDYLPQKIKVGEGAILIDTGYPKQKDFLI